MRICHLVTLAALVAARDSAAAQSVSVMAQMVPVLTRAAPTVGHRTLTEGYLSQPMVMAHASWGPMRGIATANFEGLTLDRGELNTGGYGEGYVDRRHPHSYIHELLVGAEHSAFGVRGSLFAGRGFAPFGSDDPMVRPFEKYPVNHHLSQVLERVVAVVALRTGPVIAELATFNGDEPATPRESPDLDRFGDSWATRLTLLPIAGAELSGSIARVTSPEERTGAGLDQHKSSVVARYDVSGRRWSRYLMAEWARTNELENGRRTTTLATMLGEGSICRAGVSAALRVERTDRAEEEPLLNPFRVSRPAHDLSNLGVSRWATVTLALSAPPVRANIVTGRPFVELSRVSVGPGDPPGIFNPDFRYGTRQMWMMSMGVRLRAGTVHGRMGRYGAALPANGTSAHPGGFESMPGMGHDMPAASSAAGSPSSMINPCGL